MMYSLWPHSPTLPEHHISDAALVGWHKLSPPENKSCCDETTHFIYQSKQLVSASALQVYEIMLFDRVSFNIY